MTFGIIDDEQDKAANIADLVFHEEQSSYLAGVAAAKATKKNHIGFIGGGTSRHLRSSRRASTRARSRSTRASRSSRST